ncbi:MAG: tetratricopeptide repeat protein [Calditrichota bacterium]
MKRYGLILMLLVFAGLYLIGCASPQQKAQALFNAGNYEQVVAQYGNDPSCAGLVADSKEKIAEKMLADGKYAAVLEMYPDTKAAKEAENKLAEQLFVAGKYEEVIAKYPNSPFAMKAKTALEAMKMEEEAKATEDAKTKGKADATAKLKEMNLKADAEFNKIMGIKMKDLRMKALKEFIAKPEFKGTNAIKKAQAELSK